MVKSPVTLKEIALIAGCSPRAVAAALNPGNGNVKVGKATQERIAAIAAEMGYRTNELARAMVSGKSRVLGVAMDGSKMAPRDWMLGGILEEASLHGYIVKILTFEHGKDPEVVINRAREWRLGGLIGLLITTEAATYLSQQTAHYGIPFSLLGSMPTDYEGRCVASDDLQGIALPVEHLAGLGHRKMGYIGGDNLSSVSQRREDGFVAALRSLDLPVEASKIRNASWYDHNVIRAAVTALLQESPPTAVVCAGDTLAMSVIRGAREVGLRVPEQLSVTGFGNLEFASFVDPPLTSIEQSFPLQGQIALRQLICAIEDEECVEKPLAFTRPAFQEKIANTLVLRASTAPPR